MVAVSAAAPAFACSPTSSLVLTAFTANYRNHLNAGTAQPDLIEVSSVVTNSGIQPTSGYTRTLTIPPNLFETVSSTTPTGYRAPTISGSGTLGSATTLTYARNLPLESGAVDTFSVTLTVGNTAAPAFRGWQGPAFALSGTVDGGATCNALSPTGQVAATPSTTLAVAGWAARREWASANLWVGTSSAGGPASTVVANTGRKAVGPITLEVRVPETSGRYAAVDAAAPDNIASGWEFVSRTPASNTVGPWTYTFRTTSPALLAPDQLNGTSTNHQTPPFRARILLSPAFTLTSPPNPTNITAVASTPGATSSAVASDNAE